MTGKSLKKITLKHRGDFKYKAIYASPLKIMNVYDFDGTIYNGDSTRDFYFYLLGKHIRVARVLPSFLIDAIRYKFSLINKTKMKETFYRFLKMFNDGEIDNLVLDFWETHRDRIFKWYYEKHKNDDVVISASPRFILQPICNELNANLICSEVNVKNGDYIGLNCYGEEKVKRFYKEYSNAIIEEFYSDSKSDEPLAKLAKRAYKVLHGGKIIEWR